MYLNFNRFIICFNYHQTTVTFARVLHHPKRILRICLQYGFTQVIIDQLGSSQCSGIYCGRATTKTIELNPTTSGRRARNRALYLI